MLTAYFERQTDDSRSRVIKGPLSFTARFLWSILNLDCFLILQLQQNTSGSFENGENTERQNAKQRRWGEEGIFNIHWCECYKYLIQKSHETDACLIDENKAVVKKRNFFFLERRKCTNDQKLLFKGTIEQGPFTVCSCLPVQCTLTCVSKQQKPIQQVKEISGLETPTMDTSYDIS